jgi:hypothetical protein
MNVSPVSPTIHNLNIVGKVIDGTHPSCQNAENLKYYHTICRYGHEFCVEYNLPEDYSWWPEDMKMLFKLTHG